MTTPEIRIMVDGRLALTTAQAAGEFGVSPITVRGEVRQLGIEPVAHLDARTPLYPAVILRQAWRARPGRGGRRRNRKQS